MIAEKFDAGVDYQDERLTSLLRNGAIDKQTLVVVSAKVIDKLWRSSFLQNYLDRNF